MATMKCTYLIDFAKLFYYCITDLFDTVSSVKMTLTFSLDRVLNMTHHPQHTVSLLSVFFLSKIIITSEPIIVSDTHIHIQQGLRIVCYQMREDGTENRESQC